MLPVWESTEVLLRQTPFDGRRIVDIDLARGKSMLGGARVHARVKVDPARLIPKLDSCWSRLIAAWPQFGQAWWQHARRIARFLARLTNVPNSRDATAICSSRSLRTANTTTGAAFRIATDVFIAKWSNAGSAELTVADCVLEVRHHWYSVSAYGESHETRVSTQSVEYARKARPGDGRRARGSSEREQLGRCTVCTFVRSIACTTRIVFTVRILQLHPRRTRR